MAFRQWMKRLGLQNNWLEGSEKWVEGQCAGRVEDWIAGILDLVSRIGLGTRWSPNFSLPTL